MNYVDLEDVKDYLGVKHTEEDVLLTRLISSASNFIESYCNRKFNLEEFTDYFNGNNGSYHVCQQWPVISVSSISSENATINLKVIDGRSIYVKEIFPKGIMNCSMTYQAGYSILPEDLKQAIIELVSVAYKQKDNINLSSKNMGNETTSFIVKAMPDFVAIKLKQYRRVFWLILKYK